MFYLFHQIILGNGSLTTWNRPFQVGNDNQTTHLI